MLITNFSALGENEMEKPHIELEVVTTVESIGEVFFKVKNNKRNSNFNAGKDYFNASNKIKICSVDFPEWDGNSMMLCVQGQLHALDDMILNATSVEFERIQQAVYEYNKKFYLPEFVFRVSIDNIDTSIETTLNKLKQDTSWKDFVCDKFKVFADEVLPVDATYNIECIQVNDKRVFTEFTFIIDSNPSLKKVRIVADIGNDDWSVYYLRHDIYEL